MFSLSSSDKFFAIINRAYRSEILNKYIFDSIEELQTITDDWLIFYNNKRPHS